MHRMSHTETESHHVSTDLRSNVRGSTCGNFTMYVGPRDVLLSIERDLHESTINSLALILEIGSVSE